MRLTELAMRNTKGVSLIEMLLALLLTGVVTAAVFKLYVNHHKNWTIQGEITEMQQNARAAIDELSRQIRMAGYGLPAEFSSIEGYNTNPDTIIISFAKEGCIAPIVHSMPMKSSELRCDGHDISCFNDSDWAYIFDPVTGDGEYFEITAVQTSSSSIQHNTMDLSKTYDSGSVVFSLHRLKFYIDNSDSMHPRLMVKPDRYMPQSYAENIEDLQFRYKMKNGLVADIPNIPYNIREILISLIARTDNPDPDFANEPFRRRYYRTKVNVRNLDI
jgi:hypothetical protein